MRRRPRRTRRRGFRRAAAAAGRLLRARRARRARARAAPGRAELVLAGSHEFRGPSPLDACRGTTLSRHPENGGLDEDAALKEALARSTAETVVPIVAPGVSAAAPYLAARKASLERSGAPSTRVEEYVPDGVVLKR